MTTDPWEMLNIQDAEIDKLREALRLATVSEAASEAEANDLRTEVEALLEREAVALTARDNAMRESVTAKAEVEALRADAERWRFLLRDGDLSPRDIFDTRWLMETGTLNDMNAAVDAAIARLNAEGK